MPHFDLRQDDGTLDPLAVFKVLAVMCHPGDRIRRERMLGNIEKETGLARPRRRPIASDVFFEEVRHASGRAAVAGSFLLTLFQLHHDGYPPSLNLAMPLVAAPLPKWQQPQSPYWSKTCHFEHRPRSRTTMLQAYNGYRSVTHLWAALLHGQEHSREDIWPGSPDTLPTFLGYAEAILGMALRLPSFAGDRRVAIEPKEAWSFSLSNPIPQVKLLVLPLHKDQLAILNEHLAVKSLV